MKGFIRLTGLPGGSILIRVSTINLVCESMSPPDDGKEAAHEATAVHSYVDGHMFIVTVRERVEEIIDKIEQAGE